MIGRLNTDGSLDTSFDTDGWTTVDFNSGTDTAYAMAIQEDGKIVVAGDSTASVSGSGGDFALVRLNSDGSVDTAGFGTSGKAVTSFTSFQDGARAVAIDDKGRIVAAGLGNNDSRIARYDTAGVLDSNFGTSGKTTVNVSGVDSTEDMQIDPFGRIILGATTDTNAKFGVVRLTDAGAVDTSFGTSGQTIVDFGAGTEQVRALMIQPDGRIVLAGQSNGNFAVARFHNGGARHYVIQDANFNVTGLTDATGVVIERYRYDAYGTQTVLNADWNTDFDNTSDVGNTYGFQGTRKDLSSGNNHHRNRDLHRGDGGVDGS